MKGREVERRGPSQLKFLAMPLSPKTYPSAKVHPLHTDTCQPMPWTPTAYLQAAADQKPTENYR